MPDPLLNPFDHLPGALGLPEGASPFPWQRRLLQDLLRGDVPDALDLPTGLGKTSVIALWLLARAAGARLPRRLVYVVDRRAVVDQATEEAERVRGWLAGNPPVHSALGLGDRVLPISTLRGQHVDNRAWLEDPACSAIVVGTVDMVGSRLLFSGYGVSWRTRPYQAGLLGRDTLLVLDEAHLVPPFEALVRAVAAEVDALGAREALPVGPLRVLSLSATARAGATRPFGLDAADAVHPTVRRRVHAVKRLSVQPDGEGRLADALVSATRSLLQEVGGSPSVIVFCDRRDDAERVARDLQKRDPSAVVELFVGARRVAERELARNRLAELGFLAGAPAPDGTVRILVATSAAEVGVDLDADHLVGDVVAWERLVQRLGRVNRRGLGTARVIVAATPPEHVRKAMGTSPPGPLAARHAAVLALLARLPEDTGGRDASPAALRALAATPGAVSLVAAATSPAPLRPPLDRATVEAWAMTSVDVHPARPLVAPWLRGWAEEEEPQVRLAWRDWLPQNADPPLSDAEVARWFESVPIHTSEVLETEAWRAAAWLVARVASVESRKTRGTDAQVGEAAVATLLGDRRTPERTWTLAEIAALSKDRLEGILGGRTLVVDARLGGLRDGLLDEATDERPPTADGPDRWMDAEPPPTRFRVRRVKDPAPVAADDAGWSERARFVAQADLDEVIEWRVVDLAEGEAATEDDRSAGPPQSLEEHQEWAAAAARELAGRLGLDRRETRILETAAALHDEGKRAERWQEAMRAPRDGTAYAKTRGPCNARLLQGYRHELGSLPIAEADPRVAELPDLDRDLVLHLVAAHHGGARPLLSTEGCDDATGTALQRRAQAVALRYVRLQDRLGPWGLAWWEAVLRAADQRASRDNDLRGRAARKGGA